MKVQELIKQLQQYADSYDTEEVYLRTTGGDCQVVQVFHDDEIQEYAGAEFVSGIVIF